MHSDLWLLTCGGSQPWQDDPDVIKVSCPGRIYGVVYELRRLRE